MKNIFIFLSLLSTTSVLFSQEKAPSKKPRFYFSWGYNTERYSKSNIHIVQSKLNNDYTFNNTLAHDKIGWNHLFQNDLTIPQYNYRLGYFFNKKQNLAIELNFDHTKYVVTEGQQIHVTGTMHNSEIDTTIITGNQILAYQLNNGANFFLINLVKQVGLYSPKSKKVNLNFLGKIGVGPVIPHVQNTIFGKENIPHFQFGGWNTGIEAAIKATFFNYVYLEFCGKLDFANYAKLKIYEGYANHHFITRELILNLGINFPCRKEKTKSITEQNR